MIALPQPSRTRVAPRDSLLVLLALAPIYAVYALQFSRPDATGFIQYDMPYYLANGREAFDRGSSLLHANPYDPDPRAPAIYFHWLTYLLGFGVTQFGLDPGLLFVGVGVIAGWLGGWLTLKIVEHLVPDACDRPLLFLLTMWGGGLLAVGKIAVNLCSGEPLLEKLLAFDPASGWWFLNWGRNFLFPTEAVYHALVAAAWLCVLRGKDWAAMGIITLLAATHPFSGLQHLLILGAWNLVQLIKGKQLAALGRGLTITAVLVVFLGYYFVFLEMHASHRALRHLWSLAWIVPLNTLLLAYGPVAIAAAVQWKRSAARFTPETWFFATAFVVSLLLVKHDWFVRARQPVHFTRGYVWMPLMLLALPLLAKGLQHLRENGPVWRRYLALAGVGLLAVSDNLAFYGETLSKRECGRYLPPEAHALFAWASGEKLQGVLLAPDEDLSYLSATYTALQPYYGHRFNTPQVQRRWQELDSWNLKGVSGPWLDQIDLLLLKPGESPKGFRSEQWKLLKEHEGYRLYEQIRTEKRQG